MSDHDAILLHGLSEVIVETVLLLADLEEHLERGDPTILFYPEDIRNLKTVLENQLKIIETVNQVVNKGAEPT